MTNSLSLSKEEVEQRIANGEQYVVRAKIEPHQEIVVHDLIRGDVRVNSSILDDKVLYKSADQLPTYHLANIVDDHLMEISHVIRGEEWLPSAPLHVLLYRFFGWEESMPEFAHLSLLLKPDGNGKLSKRDGDRLGFPVFPLQWKDPKTGEVSSGYRESGYFPEAVINFLALLGWNPGTEQEIMSMDELISLFKLERCNKSGARFDYEKGKWFNHMYLQNRDNGELAALFMPTVEEHGYSCSMDKLATIIGLVKSRATFVKELWDQCYFYFQAPNSYDEKAIQKRWKEDTPQLLTALVGYLESLTDAEFNSIETSEKMVIGWCESNGYNLGAVMNPFRLSVVGALKGPHMFAITALLGKEETLARVKRALQSINQ